jgi:hypothetical protein
MCGMGLMIEYKIPHSPSVGGVGGGVGGGRGVAGNLLE